MANDLNDVIRSAKAKRKRDQDLIIQIGSLIRWQTMMIIKGFHAPNDFKKTDWELFDHEREERIKNVDVDTDKYEKIWEQMDREREEEIRKMNNG